MKKLFLLICIILILVGCGKKEEKEKPYSLKLHCIFSEINVFTDHSEKTEIVLEFDSNNELMQYRERFTEFIPDDDDYNSMKEFSQEYWPTDQLKIEDGFAVEYDDEEKTISHLRYKKPPFDFDNLSDRGHPLEYEATKEFYLNRGYTCDGVASTQIDTDDIFTYSSKSIIYNDKIYFLDTYNNKTLSVVDLDGKNKQALVVSNYPEILFIINDYLFYKDYVDRYSINNFRINLNDHSDVVNTGEALSFESVRITKEEGGYHSLIGPNKEQQASNIPDYKKLDPIYEKYFIYATYAYTSSDGERIPYRIYRGPEVIHSGNKRFESLVVDENFLYFTRESETTEGLELVKFNLETNEIIDFINIGDMYIISYDYNENGAVYITGEKIYKLDFESFKFSEILTVDQTKKDSRVRYIYYVGKKIIYDIRYFDPYNPTYTNVIVYDEESKETEKYLSNEHFQLQDNYLYLIVPNEPIKKIDLNK